MSLAPGLNSATPAAGSGPPLFCLKGDRDAPSGTVEEATADPREKDERPVRCLACGAAVTVAGAAVEIGGEVDHAFFNPAGVLFEIRCYGTADGCVVLGDPTYEFTWFPGHAWRYAACSSCGSHLGWQFSGSERTFFGLILRLLNDPG